MYLESVVMDIAVDLVLATKDLADEQFKDSEPLDLPATATVGRSRNVVRAKVCSKNTVDSTIQINPTFYRPPTPPHCTNVCGLY